MITDAQRDELLDAAPHLSNESLDIQDKISCMMGIVFRLVSAIEISLAHAAILKAFPPERLKDLKRNREKFETEVKDKSISLSLKGFSKLKGMISSIPEFQALKDELDLANEQRDLFIHNFCEALGGLFGDKDGQWHIMWELFLLAQSFANTSKKIKKATAKLHVRLEIPAEAEDSEGLRQGLLDESMALVETGDFFGEWRRKHKANHRHEPRRI